MPIIYYGDEIMGKRIDLSGQQFGYWTVKDYAYSKNGQTYWNCICKCGTEKIVRSSCLRQGRSNSCGCYLTEKLGLKILGEKFSHLLVIKQLKSENQKTKWLCLCDCGNYCEEYGKDLVCGKITNCGCESKKHLIENGKKNFKDLTGKHIGLLTVIKRIEDKIYNNKPYVNYLCKCDCGKIIEITSSAINAGQLSCGCSKRSRGEYQIFSFLTQQNYDFQEQYKIILDTGEKRYFDFALKKEEQIIGLIEYDGEQHYKEVSIFNKSLEENQKRDLQKTQWAKNNNIPLLRIGYKDYNNIQNILKNFLKEIKYE